MVGQVLLIGVLTVTAYQPVAKQTKPECTGIQHCFTSVGDVPTKFGAAASQDLLEKGVLHYGDPVYIDGIGWRLINDTMNRRIKNSIDVMVWTHDDEKRIGVRRAKVYVANRPK